MPDWSTAVTDTIVMVPFMVLCVRLAGLRAFSKMSSYDFAVTVAFGSVLAGTVLNPGVGLGQGLVAMAALFAVQWVIGYARARVPALRDLTDNEPILLMRDGEPIAANMARARITMPELRAKLREANALDPAQVRAVVLETTGDVSVLHGEAVAQVVLKGVRGAA